METRSPGPTPIVACFPRPGDPAVYDGMAAALHEVWPDVEVLSPAVAERSTSLIRVTRDLDEAIAHAVDRRAHVLLLPPGAHLDAGVLAAVVAQLEADLGIASISGVGRSLLNAWEKGSPGDVAVSSLSDRAVAGRLAFASLRPFSVAHLVGLPVMLSRSALSRVPGLPAGDTDEDRLRAWCRAVSARAFAHLVDPHWFAGDTGDVPVPILALDEPHVVDVARRVRVATRGLRVHIDGRTFADAETGTEVQTANLIRALARRPEVGYVGVNLRGTVPDYAEFAFEDQKVHAIEGCGEWSDDIPEVDVFHRPYQPLDGEDTARWRRHALRTSTTMQDMISYLSPPYHRDDNAWRSWRAGVRDALRLVDGVFTISEYVRGQLVREELCAEDRVWVAPNGVDHLLDAGASSTPPELVAAGCPRFALVLGSDYGHKNIDLAHEAVLRLHDEGHDLALVTAGRQVTDGAVRVDRSHGVLALGRNVSTEERNWLLANAAVVVFPTSAEGFGLVPFEAATYGTPTVCVSFGPLDEYLGKLPITVPEWSSDAFASAIRDVLRDSDAAAAQVAATRAAATHLTWDRTAAAVLAGFYEMLGRPLGC